MAAHAKKSADRNDLRWRRTEKLLLGALGQELEHTPLDKVKVITVCETAEVSKAAFYAHFHDIYDLADAFIDAAARKTIEAMMPASSTDFGGAEFVSRCVRALRNEEQAAFVRIAGANRMIPRYLDRIYAEAEARVMQSTSRPLSPAEQIAMTYILIGTIGTIQAHPEIPDDILASTLAQLTRRTGF